MITRTVKFKLPNLTSKNVLNTLTNCTSAFNYICNIGYTDKDFNSVSLHNKTYSYCRSVFKLPSELASQVRMQAAATVKACIQKERKKHKTFSCPKSKLISVQLSKNSFNVWFDKSLVSILTCEGRIKTEIKISDFSKQYISWKRKSATLQLKDSKVYLNIVFEKEILEPEYTDNIVGIDRGIVNIAATSNGALFSSEHVYFIKNKYKTLRANLQSCGSKSAKRHLKRVSHKENRFMTDVNHCISKKIVESCSEGTTLVLEKLTNIRDNSKKFRKTERAKINNWSFFQLEQFLIYKALAKGCKVEYVDARYTSQKCSKCGHIDSSNRKDQAHFKCTKCGFEINADLNAAINIENNFRASVNKPIVAGSNT